MSSTGELKQFIVRPEYNTKCSKLLYKLQGLLFAVLLWRSAWHPQVGLYEVPWELGKPGRSGNLHCWDSLLPQLFDSCMVPPAKRSLCCSELCAQRAGLALQLTWLATVPRAACTSKPWAPHPRNCHHEHVLLVGTAAKRSEDWGLCQKHLEQEGSH